MAGATTLDTDNPEAGIAEPVEQPAAPDPTAQLQIDVSHLIECISTALNCLTTLGQKYSRIRSVIM